MHTLTSDEINTLKMPRLGSQCQQKHLKNMKRLFQKEEKVTEDMNDELQKNDVFPSQTSTGEKKKS